MSAETLARFVRAWNAADADAIATLAAPGARWCEPGVEPLALAAGLPARLAYWHAAFADCTLSLAGTPPDATRGWVGVTLAGRHSGAGYAGLAPSGVVWTLPAVLGYAVDDGQRLTRLDLVYDRQALAEALGAEVLVLPGATEAAHYGYALRVTGTADGPPGVIALTWIEAADEAEKARIRAYARANVGDFQHESGFLGIVTGFTGLRGFTVTAWRDEAALARALAGAHSTAQRALFGERFVSAVWTSVWQPLRVNRLWQRCPACGTLAARSETAQCTACKGALPATPAYW